MLTRSIFILLDSVSGMSDVTGFIGVERRKSVFDCLFQGVLCSGCSFAQKRFELGEDLFDRVEIGTVGREEQQPRALGPDRGPDGRPLVAGEVVHDDDVARPQRRAELLLDPCGEGRCVDRLIEDVGRIDPVAAQRGNEGHRLPVAVRDFGVEPLADRRPPTQRRHVRLGPGLIDEDEPPRIRPALELPPLLAPPDDLRPQLLGGKNAFF